MYKTSIFILCLLVLAFSVPAQAKEWYEGGNLHSSSVQEWLTASPDNIVATTGDIVAATTESSQLRSLSSDTLKNASIEAAKCMVTATEGVHAVSQQQGASFVVLCLATLREQYPWILSKEKQ